MEASILSQMIAAALAISQIVIDPANLRTTFHPINDQAQVTAILRQGCDRSFEEVMRELGLNLSVQDAGFDEMLGLVVGNAKDMGVGLGFMDGLNLDAMQAAFRTFCKGENVPHPDIRLEEAITFYNETLADLPDHTRVKGKKLPQSVQILDVFGEPYTDVYKDENRRKWVPISEIPAVVQHAFVAAEDQDFLRHRGINIRGIARAYLNNRSNENRKRPEGGSTITQQLVKNLPDLEIGDEVSTRRKMREMVVAARLEAILSKQEILELYLNLIFLGRASWGVEMASRSYFGRSVRELTSLEAAFLAGLAKGPNHYNPDIFPERQKGRTAYVLNQMLKLSQKNGDTIMTAEQYERDRSEQDRLSFVNFVSPRGRRTFYFLDDIVQRTAKGLNISSITDDAYVIRTTIHPKIQPLVEAELQEGLAKYEISHGRVKWTGPEGNIEETIRQFIADNPDEKASTAWNKVLLQTRAPLYDVHWPLAVVLSQKGGQTLVGVPDGRLLTLKAWNRSIPRKLKIGDLVHVRIMEAGKKGGEAHASLRFRPQVQGAVVVLENRSGRVLGLTGGFSYVQSQYNRAVLMQRQPGSTVKPLTYLTAFARGLSPNSVLPDVGITFPPVVRGPGARSWSVGPGRGRMMTLRQGLTYSNNQVTARLLYRISRNPVQSLDMIIGLCKEIKLCQTKEPGRYFPFILGAEEVRLIDLTSFYATIANDGVRAAPFFVESITLDGQEVFSMKGESFRAGLKQISSVPVPAFREVKSILQDVVDKGTARASRDLAPYVGGKTGTTNSGVDAWFVGFTNDLTIGVWVGYDNQRRSLGGNATGGAIALPIFDQIVRKTFSEDVYKVASPLNVPKSSSRTARREGFDPREDGRGGSWFPAPRSQPVDPGTYRGRYHPPPENRRYRGRPPGGPPRSRRQPSFWDFFGGP